MSDGCCAVLCAGRLISLLQKEKTPSGVPGGGKGQESQMGGLQILRACRVLRPLKLISGVASTHTRRHHTAPARTRH